ncbi:MAG: heat-inducible transcription repressor HrcA, partial [Firmicutes bacterium]|nr:heat-inducible transcription repressor HrcA [Bacillota bacterium]
KAVHMSVPYTEDKLQLLSKTMTYNYKGKTISQALTNNIIANFETDIVAMSGLAEDVMPNFMKTLEDMLNVNLYMEGLTNIFDIPEYSDLSKAKSFMEMLSQKEELTKKLIEREDGMVVTIGGENPEDILHDCSLITASYHVDGKLIGKIGVIGPTRMKYSEVTSIIQYLTDNLNDTFKLESGGNDKNGQ